MMLKKARAYYLKEGLYDRLSFQMNVVQIYSESRLWLTKLLQNFLLDVNDVDFRL